MHIYYILATPIVKSYLKPQIFKVKAFNANRALLKTKKTISKIEVLSYTYEVFNSREIEQLLLEKASYELNQLEMQHLRMLLDNQQPKNPSQWQRYRSDELEKYLERMTDKELRRIVDSHILYAMSYLRNIEFEKGFSHPFNQKLIRIIGEVLHKAPATLDENPHCGTYKSNMIRLLTIYYKEIKPFEDICFSIDFSNDIHLLFNQDLLSLIKVEDERALNL